MITPRILTHEEKDELKKWRPPTLPPHEPESDEQTTIGAGQTDDDDEAAELSYADVVDFESDRIRIAAGDTRKRKPGRITCRICNSRDAINADS